MLKIGKLAKAKGKIPPQGICLAKIVKIDFEERETAACGFSREVVVFYFKLEGHEKIIVENLNVYWSEDSRLVRLIKGIYGGEIPQTIDLPSKIGRSYLVQISHIDYKGKIYIKIENIYNPHRLLKRILILYAKIKSTFYYFAS